MRVLLIVPPGESSGLDTGQASLAAAVRQAGHPVLVLDLNNRSLPLPAAAVVTRMVDNFRPAVVGFGVLSTTYAWVRSTVAELRRSYAGIIIAGGAQVHFERGRILEEIPGLDYAFLGEAETSLPAFLARCDQPVRDLPGLIRREGTEIREPAAGEVIADLDALPFPDYAAFGLLRIDEYPVMTSRGCPYRCSFCNPKQGRQWRPRSLDRVIEELRRAKANYHPQRILIEEPVFNLQPERVEEFCRRYLAAGIGLPWWCGSGLRADRVTASMARWMKQAGCVLVQLGIESLHPEIFAQATKGETLDDIRRAIAIFREAGIETQGSFIIGLPHDTAATTRYSFLEAEKLGIARRSLFSLLYPYPGTAAYEWYARHGRHLVSYKEADQILSPTRRGFRVACETDEFPAAERLATYLWIRCRQRYYPFYDDESHLRRIGKVLGFAWREDRGHLPEHLAELGRRVVRYLWERRFANPQRLERRHARDPRFEFRALDELAADGSSR